MDDKKLKTIHVYEGDWDWLTDLKKERKFASLAETICFVRRKVEK